MLATVRVLLSVAVSTKIAIPWGRNPQKPLLYNPLDFLSEARFMARSILSLGILTDLAF